MDIGKAALDSSIQCVRRFRTYCKEKSKKLKEFSTASDVKGTKVAAINHTQQFLFNAEFSFFKQKQPITDCKLKELKPFSAHS